MGITVHEMITEALKNELRSIAFYMELAEVTPSLEVKAFAQQLATEEERHCQRIVEWLEQDIDLTLREVLQEVRLLVSEPCRKQATMVIKGTEQRDLARVRRPRRALELAIAKELDSILALLALEQEVSDRLGRRVLLRLLQEEEQHKRFLQQQYRHLFEEKRQTD
jgi:rubrerythrin